jgi:hypothetical protein
MDWSECHHAVKCGHDAQLMSSIRQKTIHVLSK